MRKLSSISITITLFFLIACNEQEQATSGLLFNFESGNSAGNFVTKETSWPTIKDSVKYGLVGNFNSSTACQSDEAFEFWVELPERNYKVKVVLGDMEKPTSTTIKAESRRLMAMEHETSAGQIDTLDLLINVRTPIIDSVNSIKLKVREIGYVNWDSNLTLEFAGECPSVKSIIIDEADDVPVIFLAGNSTVVDQENEPWASWGQMFTYYLKPEVAVANFAESGETLRSFIGENRFAKIASLIKPGDYLFMEFAHNDQKPGSSYVEPYTTYIDELMKFIDLARNSGATPVLVTSTNRRKFNEDGKIVNTLEEYPDAMRKLADDEDILLIDLNAMSKDLYEALGVEGSKKAFVHYAANTFPWQREALADNTHFSTYGAWQLAKCVVQEILDSNAELGDFIKEGFGSYDPTQPDSFKSWEWPVSKDGTVLKPDGN